jgi:hypothetical protein
VTSNSLPVSGFSLSSPFSSSSLLLLSVSWWWRRIWMGIREAGWGLGSYRWPARVWSPKGTAGILGIRACGHAAHIRVRQNGGAAAMGAGAVLAPRRASRRSRDRR